MFVIAYYLDQEVDVFIDVFKESDLKSGENEKVIKIEITIQKTSNLELDIKDEANQKLLGISNILYLQYTINSTDIKLTNSFFILNTGNIYGILKIDNNEYLIMSDIYLNIYYDMSSFQNKVLDQIFSLTINELNKNIEDSSLIEMVIMSSLSFISITSIIYTWVSSLL